MAKKTPTWVIGCGIGCGVILLAVIGLGAAGAFWIKNTVRGFGDAVEGRARLEERFGQPEEFTPWPDGSIPAERIEAFLGVREKLAPSREAIVAVFEKMPLSEDEIRALDESSFFDKIGKVFDIGTSAMGLGIRMGDFFRDRNNALIEAGMGMGEYSYIYVLAYYSMLGHSPSDGPGSERAGESGARTGTVQVMGPHVRARIRRELLSMLKNQRDALAEDAPAAWREALTAEIETMEEDRRRMPWPEGLPEPIRASLEPFSDRLEAAYEPLTNPFELARNRKRGRYSYTAD